MEIARWKFWAAMAYVATMIGLYWRSDYVKDGATGRAMETAAVIMFVILVAALLYWFFSPKQSGE